MSEYHLPPLLLLHGALGTKQTLSAISEALSSEFEIFCPDLPGHGEHSGDGRAFTTLSLVDYLNDYILSEEIGQPVVFGYSLGGYLALALASKYPDSIAGIVTLGTKLAWDTDTAEEEAVRLDPTVIQANSPQFADLLMKRHGEENWTTVLAGTAELMRRLGSDPVIKHEMAKTIKVPVKLCVGSEDKMVTMEETDAIAQHIPNCETIALKGVRHAIEKSDPKQIADLVRQFAGNLNSNE